MVVSEARELLRDWKGDSYIFGQGALDRMSTFKSFVGDRALLICSNSEWARGPVERISGFLNENNISYGKALSARPNCPREDLYRVALNIKSHDPDCVIALGGGSTIDCAKAASVLATYGPSEVSEALGVDWGSASTMEPYFGTGMVTAVREATGRDIYPILAVQTASGSAAHLTKYSNITDPMVDQKKLIVDEAVVPGGALFDYGVTYDAPRSLVLDGGLDGIAHLWEVFMGATDAGYEKIKRIASVGMELILGNLRAAVADREAEAFTALGLGTDLGGYAIMVGGTNGPHLGSFSLVDVLSHGRACAILYPYYTAFFAEEIQDQLRTIAPIMERTGLIDVRAAGLSGRALGDAVAEGMMRLNGSLSFPTTLREAGATEGHLERMLEAAKNPQLRMKLMNMPVPMDPEAGDIERYMAGVLKAAYTGDLRYITAKEK